MTSRLAALPALALLVGCRAILGVDDLTVEQHGQRDGGGGSLGGGGSGGLECAGGTTRCGNACADTKIDPANCGGCGIECEAGGCNAGLCPSAHIWSKRFGDDGPQGGGFIAVDGSGNALMAGEFWCTVDFGGGPLASVGMSDIFVAKFAP
ncbi:MAG: hypothetical protein HY744_33305 [Deltaproteobacteria bacterium]|nr:hypothetical protein [Deltaproteobacteria bacterium]